MNRTLFGHSFSLLTLSLIAAWSAPLTALADPPSADNTPTTAKTATSDSSDDAGNKESGKKESRQNESGKNESGQKEWKPLKGAWVISQFGGDGPVEIEDNSVKIGFGDPLTGIRWEGDVLRENYEVELEARRTDGYDFFCGLTFPVGKDHVSFILGGWGGGVVGISSIDGSDASENETTSFRNFDNDTWYKVRVRVEPNEIRCWIDDKAAAEHVREGHTFDIRYEMDQCVPLGVAAFQCKSELRNLRMRALTAKEIAAAKKPSAGSGTETETGNER